MLKRMILQQILQLSNTFGWIWTIPESERNAAELMHDAWLGVVHDAERDRYQEVSRMRKEIRAWSEEPGMVTFAKAARLRYLKGCLSEAHIEWKQARNAFIEAIRVYGDDSVQSRSLERVGAGILKKIRGYELSIAVLDGKIDEKDVLTDEMIARAKAYPMKNFIELGPNGRARCIFHQGEDFNMDIRKNFAHCYVCGESGDTIKVYREKMGVSFREAVISLQ